jgi:hypothetical protein
MRRHALWAAAIVLVLGAGTAQAAKPPSSTRASGTSPFPAEGCGQIDHSYYGAGLGKETDLALAADPGDPRHLVAAWIQDEGFGIVTATRALAGGDAVGSARGGIHDSS